MPFDPTREVPARDIRRWAMFCHLGGLAFYVFPVFNVVVPVFVWLARRELDPYIDRQGCEAINFQISLLLYGSVISLAFWLLLTAPIGVPLWPVWTVWSIGHIGGTVAGSIRAMDGEDFRYPLILRFVSPAQTA